MKPSQNLDLIAWPFFSYLNACIIVLTGRTSIPGIPALGVGPKDITDQLEKGDWMSIGAQTNTEADLALKALDFLSLLKPEVATDPESANWREEFAKILEQRRIAHQRHGDNPEYYTSRFRNDKLPDTVVRVHCPKDRTPVQHSAVVRFESDLKLNPKRALDYIERGLREFFEQRHFTHSAKWARKKGKAGSEYLFAYASTGGRDECSIRVSAWFHGDLVSRARKHGLWLPQTYIIVNRYQRSL